eukprot:jgi/Chrzof1/1428/Cz10g07190.t1
MHILPPGCRGIIAHVRTADVAVETAAERNDTSNITSENVGLLKTTLENWKGMLDSWGESKSKEEDDDSDDDDDDDDVHDWHKVSAVKDTHDKQGRSFHVSVVVLAWYVSL